MLRTLLRAKKKNQPENVEILSEECDRGIIANKKNNSQKGHETPSIDMQGKTKRSPEYPGDAQRDL